MLQPSLIHLNFHAVVWTGGCGGSDLLPQSPLSKSRKPTQPKKKLVEVGGGSAGKSL